MKIRDMFREEFIEALKKMDTTRVYLTAYDKEGIVLLVDEPLEEKCFTVVAKTQEGLDAMAKAFVGKEIDGRMHYPFDTSYRLSNKSPDKFLATVAAVAGVKVSDLDWLFINER